MEPEATNSKDPGLVGGADYSFLQKKDIAISLGLLTQKLVQSPGVHVESVGVDTGQVCVQCTQAFDVHGILRRIWFFKPEIRTLDQDRGPWIADQDPARVRGGLDQWWRAGEPAFP